MLSFDTDKCIKDFLNAVDRELDIVAQHGVEYMIYEIGKTMGAERVGGRTEWKQNVIDALKHRGRIKALGVVKEFGLIDPDELTMHQAFLVNYGTGKTTDTSHPYIEDYKSSLYYDTTRQNMIVNTRPGEYIYDYNTGGWKLGASIEHAALPELYQYPTHFFENALAFIEDEFEGAIIKVLESFDFSKYLISSIK